jgi:tetratricopeptide (TPR) repeat protein/Zn-dependent protease with chaperone function
LSDQSISEDALGADAGPFGPVPVASVAVDGAHLAVTRISMAEGTAMKARGYWIGVSVAILLLIPPGTREASAQDPKRSDAKGQGPARPQTSAPGGGDSKVSDELARLVQTGIDAERKGDWSRAAQLYEEVLRRVPDLQPARLHLGVVLVLSGRDAEGRKNIEAALGANPEVEELLTLIVMLEEGAATARQPPSRLIRISTARALDRAKALDYAASHDVMKLSAIARLAVDSGDDKTFRAATASLVRNHPDGMEAHYFSSIRAAKDGDWVTAEDEIQRAGELGLPREVVDQVLASGLHARASNWRYLYYTRNAAIAWVLGLCMLFVGGKILSVVTLKSAESDDPNVAITPLQRNLRRAYRVVINVAALYYYISLPFVALLAIAAAVGFGYGVLMLGRIPVKLLGLVFLFGVAMISTIWSSIRSLFFRLKDEDPGRAVSIEEAPRLWAVAREVAARVGTRPVDAIFLTPAAEVAVFERGRWSDKARDRARRSLILGMGVVDGFRLDPFRAVLAHEYGHFLHRDTAGGDVALRVNATIGRFAMAMLERGNAQWWNIGWQFIRLYHWLFRRITHGASRLQEINADRVAARSFGKEAFEEGLRHVIRRDLALRYRKAIEESAPAGNGAADSELGPGRNSKSFLRAEARRQVEADVATLWNAKTSEDDTHPCPADRIRLIGRLAVAPASPCCGPGRNGHDEQRHTLDAPSLDHAHRDRDADIDVEELFEDSARLRAERDERLAREVSDHLVAKRAYCTNLIGQIDAYLAQHPGLADPFRQRGDLRMELGDYRGAVADYTEGIKRDGPKTALCYYGRGLARSELGDLDGAADDLRRAMAEDPSLEWEQARGQVELGGILLRAGDTAAAIAQYDRAIERDPDGLGLYLQRSEAHTIAGDLTRADADFTRALELDPHCAEALAGRARTRAAQGRHAEATADALAAARIEPDLATLEPAPSTTTAPGIDPIGSSVTNDPVHDSPPGSLGDSSGSGDFLD